MNEKPISIEGDELKIPTFNHPDGLGKTHQQFREHLPRLPEEPNPMLAA